MKGGRKGWYLCTTLFVVSRLIFCKYPRVFRRVWHGISDPVSVINIANRYDGTDSVFVLYKNDLEYGGKLTLLRLVHCPLARMIYVRLWCPSDWAETYLDHDKLRNAYSCRTLRLKTVRVDVADADYVRLDKLSEQESG